MQIIIENTITIRKSSKKFERIVELIKKEIKFQQWVLLSQCSGERSADSGKFLIKEEY
jgi:hypothetical protein